MCSSCGRIRYISNKKLCLCRECAFKRGHEGLTPYQYYVKKQSAKSFTRPPKGKGEKELFLKIWMERPHYCINCGKYLGDTPRASFFSHRIPKSICPERRLDETNIDLLCYKCHHARDFEGEEAYEKRTR